MCKPTGCSRRKHDCSSDGRLYERSRNRCCSYRCQSVRGATTECECLLKWLVFHSSCPGSNMFLFRFPNGKVVLHTGDFRAAPNLLAHPFLQPNQIDTVYLDTTYVQLWIVLLTAIRNSRRYCDSHYRFPPQDQVIESAVELVTDTLRDHPRTLVAVGAYLVGKERVFHGRISRARAGLFNQSKCFYFFSYRKGTRL